MNRYAIILALLCLGLSSPPETSRAARDEHASPLIDLRRYQASGMEEASIPMAPAPLDSRAAAADSLPLKIRTTNRNLVGLAVWNNGFFGTNFSSRAPSFEFPLGERDHYDHMVRGGLWVGGLVDTSGAIDTLVTTGTIDGYYGSDPRTASEFAPADSIVECSRIRGAYYCPEAKSQQDFLTSFNDLGERTYHRPLGVRVDLETLVWDYDPFRSIVILNFIVTNINPHPIKGLALGFYAELATGFKDPALTNPFQGWFRQKDIAYYDSLRTVSEHRYGTNYPWCGVTLLGTHPIDIRDLPVSFNWWRWNTEAPLDDAERYRVMVNGQKDNTDGFEADNDPVEVLSVGPFPGLFHPGERDTIAFAFLGGREGDPRTGGTAQSDLIFNAQQAQTAFDLDYDVPVPPPSPRLLVQPERQRLTLRWKDTPESFIDPKTGLPDFEGYRVYIGETQADRDIRLLRQVDVVDSIFYNTGLEALREETVIGADTFAYRYDIVGLKDGFKYWTSVTSFDTGGPDIPSLESGRSQNEVFVIPGDPSRHGHGQVRVFPNPYRGDAVWDGTLTRDRYLWFINLPSRCAIRIYTLAGDLVDTIHFDGATYQPTDIRGIFDPTDRFNPESDIPVLTGNMAAWDLISKKDQGIANGLYLYSVEDLDTGNVELGKFLVLK